MSAGGTIGASAPADRDWRRLLTSITEDNRLVSKQLGRVWAVVPAAGIGERMGSKCPKQYLEVAGQSILAHALRRLAEHPRIHAVLPVVRAEDPYWPEVRRQLEGLSRLLPEATGGTDRQESVRRGVAALGSLAPEDWVLIHDAVRPCLRNAEIDTVIGAAEKGQASILGVPVADTLKRVDEAERIEATVDRSRLWRAQTPQVFPYEALVVALEQAWQRGQTATDEAAVMEAAGYPVYVVPGRSDNLKITSPEDLVLARVLLGAPCSG